MANVEETVPADAGACVSVPWGEYAVEYPCAYPLIALQVPTSWKKPGLSGSRAASLLARVEPERANGMDPVAQKHILSTRLRTFGASTIILSARARSQTGVITTSSSMASSRNTRTRCVIITQSPDFKLR